MQTIKYTFLLPSYKALFFEEALLSIKNHTYTDFELLLIDDGSKDNSGRICDEYAEKDSRVHVYHKENGGVSSARNIGIDNANGNGNWITFVDSDDWIEMEYLSNFSKEFDLSLQRYLMVTLQYNITNA